MRVDLDDVRKSFGRNLALRGITARVQSGERVALVGANGSGKSTLIRAVLGLVSIEGGVRLDGETAGLNRPPALMRRTAYVPQLPPQTGVSVGEMIDTVSDARRLAPHAVAELVAGFDLEPDRLRSRPFRELSGGMKHKVLLALALAARPALLVLDEPTASLDIASRAKVMHLLQESTLGTTMLLCSHRLEEIRRLVDRVIVLEQGRIAFDGAAAGYLSNTEQVVLEVHVRTASGADRLRALGFHEESSGWWSRPVSAGGKVRLLQDALRGSADELDDLLVREGERLELPDRAHG